MEPNPPIVVYDTSGPFTDPEVEIDVRRGLAPLRAPWIAARGDSEELGQASSRFAAARAADPRTAGLRFTAGRRPRRATGRPPDHPDALRPPRRGDAGDGVRRPPRERAARPHGRRPPRPRPPPPRRVVGGGAAGAGHPGVRARRDRPRARHPAGERQPSGARADGDRPQSPGQDQRQPRHLRGHQLDRGGGGEDGVGDPLGGRHGDGPLHRPPHPRDPRVDPAQRPGADRHGADLPGAGEGGRPPGGADLGPLPRHPDRAGRAGGGLLHPPRRRAAALRAVDRPPPHRHRQPRRLDPRQVVPGPPPGELPLHPLGRSLRDPRRLRRLDLARRRPPPGLDRGRQRRGAVRRAEDPGRADHPRLGAGRPGDERGPGAHPAAPDPGEHDQAARSGATRRRSTPWGRSPPTSLPATTTSPRRSAPR